MFSYQMSYWEIRVILMELLPKTGQLSRYQWKCIQLSLSNSLVQELLNAYPLPSKFQKMMRAEQQRLRAENHQADQIIDLGVHSILYGGARAKTEAYLKYKYPPQKTADLCHQLSKIVHEAFENPEIVKELLIAEDSRYQERQKAYAKKELKILLEKNSIEKIQSDFTDYLKHLEDLKRKNSTYSWDLIDSLLQHLQTDLAPESRIQLLTSLILSLDDGRTAYHLSNKKFITEKDYSCAKGLHERLLDHHQFLCSQNPQHSMTVVEDMIGVLLDPFIQNPGANDGCGPIFSQELYEIYLDAAGYEQSAAFVQHVWQFAENIDIGLLRKQYLSLYQDPFRPWLAEREFDNTIIAIQYHLIQVSDARNHIVNFLIEQHALKEGQYQPDDQTLTRNHSISDSEDSIIDRMLKNGPFLDRSHLKIILALHDTAASCSTLKAVAEDGIMALPQKRIFQYASIEAYGKYLEQQQISYYDFYLNHSVFIQRVLESFANPLHNIPCSQEVLIHLLQGHHFFQKGPFLLKKIAILCAKIGYAQALELCISDPYRISPNAQCAQEEKTLIILAAQEGHAHVVRLLLAHGAHLNQVDSQGATALCYAAQYGWEDIVCILIQSGASPNHNTYNDRTPLMLALGAGWNSIALLLIEYGANIDYLGRESPLILATRTRNADMVKTLLEYGADPNLRTSSGSCSIVHAVKNRDLESLDLLLEAGADPCHHSRSQPDALTEAQQLFGNQILVDRLLRAGVSGRDSWQYFRGLYLQTGALIEKVLTKKKKIILQKDQIINLSLGIQYGQRQKVNDILKRHPHLVNVVHDSSFLILALKSHQFEIVDDLMPPHLIAYHVIQALRYAVEHERLHHQVPKLARQDVIEMMVRQGAQQCDPVIAWAAKHDCLVAVEIFLKAGAAIDQKDRHGCSAMKYARLKKNDEIVELLQASGSRELFEVQGSPNPQIPQKEWIAERSSESEKGLFFTGKEESACTNQHRDLMRYSSSV